MEWEKARKDLGLQWIEETKGSWLESTGSEDRSMQDTASISPEQTEKHPLPDQEDEFMLQEDWAIPAPENPEKELARQENRAPLETPRDQADIPAAIPGSDHDTGTDDLLIPGLEEMLQAAAIPPDTPKIPPLPAQDPSPAEAEKNDDAIFLEEEAYPPEEDTFVLLLEPEADTAGQKLNETKILPEVGKKTASAPAETLSSNLPEPEKEKTKQTPDPQKKNEKPVQDMIEIDLEDLEIFLDEES